MSENLLKHKIKVPIFSSEIKELEVGAFFDSPDYNSLISFLKKKLDSFSDVGGTITQSRNNKVKEMQISKIEYFDFFFEQVPTLLLKISAYNTNLIDGFVEIEEKKEFKKSDKIGSDTNYVLVYPTIFGSTSSKFTYQFKFFVYDDPTKESYEIISICKLVAKKILDIKIRNLKLDKILQEIKKEKVIESIDIQLSSQTEETDDPDIDLKQYLIKSKVSKTTKNSYKDIPAESFEDLVLNKSSNFYRRVIKIFKNKRELKITQEKHKGDIDKLSNIIEEIFNSQYELNQNDLEQIFNNDFIIKNLNYALTDFYTQSE
jgi:hypothetical protein